MYKLWYCELRKPLILSTFEEVVTYCKMQYIVSKTYPRWEKIETKQQED
jgi:hypothetical protein